MGWLWTSIMDVPQSSVYYATIVCLPAAICCCLILSTAAWQNQAFHVVQRCAVEAFDQRDLWVDNLGHPVLHRRHSLGQPGELLRVVVTACFAANRRGLSLGVCDWVNLICI
jgi:hypothetical protein